MRRRGWRRRLRLHWYWLKLARRRFTALSVVSLLAVASLIALVVISTVFRDWVTGGESGSTTIRNIGLVAGGVIALWLAFWRSRVAELQAATAQRTLSNQLYQQGAEMLNSEELSVRLDGIYTLERLAKDEPERYHIQIMSRLCAFVRHPTKEDGGAAKPDEKDQLREDVQAAMTAIASYMWIGIGGYPPVLEYRPALERKANFKLDLNRADLTGLRLVGASLDGADLTHAALSGAELAGARLRDARLWSANLTQARLSVATLTNANLLGADLTGADLSKAKLTDTDFSYANLTKANLSEASLAGTTSLTQEQLDQACADPDNPPELDGVVDAETGEPLVWRGKSCEGAED